MELLHRLFGHRPDLSVTAEALVTALVISALCALLIMSLVRHWLVQSVGGGTDASGQVRANRRLIRAVLGVAMLVLTLLFVPPLLELFGEPMRGGLRLSTISTWLYRQGLPIIVIVTVAYGAHRAVSLLLHRFEHQLASDPTPGGLEHHKRARTLSQLIQRVATVLIAAIAALMILDKLDINTAPILASAGIVGLAVGFGAQTLVKDVITGFFLILENQVRVGDVAEINGVGGQVEIIRLRTIVLRDLRGAVHIFPCGSITTISNLTKDFAYAVVDIEVPLRSDIPGAMEALREIGELLQHDDHWKYVILAPLEVMGIESMSTTAVVIRTRVKTLPQRQWDVARELRYRITTAFSDKGIDLRVVQRMIMEAGATE